MKKTAPVFGAVFFVLCVVEFYFEKIIADEIR